MRLAEGLPNGRELNGNTRAKYLDIKEQPPIITMTTASTNILAQPLTKTLSTSQAIQKRTKSDSSKEFTSQSHLPWSWTSVHPWGMTHLPLQNLTSIVFNAATSCANLGHHPYYTLSGTHTHTQIIVKEITQYFLKPISPCKLLELAFLQTTFLICPREPQIPPKTLRGLYEILISFYFSFCVHLFYFFKPMIDWCTRPHGSVTAVFSHLGGRAIAW